MRLAEALATFEGVEKRFEGVVALRGFDLEILPGEVLGLLGPNGAGKTTALRILCGLLEPDAGRVSIEGRDVGQDRVVTRRSYAYVPEGAPLYANLSPIQHLRLVGRLYGRPPEAELEAEIERLLEAFGIADRAADPVGEFSRGMRQKTALACALLPQPRLLILDEPLSGLDAPTTAVIKSLLRAWADRGGAVLYTSHLLDVVERVCDRMALVVRGELVAVGTLEELRTRSGRDGTLEQVFQTLTDTEEPETAAQRILGDKGE